MRHKTSINILVISIAILSAIAAVIGICSSSGRGNYEITSFRGEKVMIYGKGAYHDMSATVAPQGIAQDVVTLFIGIPLLILGLMLANRGSVRGIILLTGALGYFLVTYLFYILMAMYNSLFLLWASLISLSFFAFALAYSSLEAKQLQILSSKNSPNRFVGGFLMFSSVTIALLWLSIVVPSVISGSYPKELEHYTTLVVQALDLSVLLPVAFIAGLLYYRKREYGYVIAPVYSMFLAILMTALTAKVLAMALLGYNVMPVIVIIPSFNIVAIASLIMCLKSYAPKQRELINDK